jgi:TonB family protein
MNQRMANRAGIAFRIGLILIFIAINGLRLSAKDPTWLELSSEHFVLFTDSDQAKAQRVLTDLETRAAVFAQAFGNIPARQFPIEIFILNNEQDFVDSAPRPQPEEKLNKSAYVLRGPDRIFVVAGDKSPDDIVSDTAHPLGHVLLERYGYWRPFWLAEAAGEYLRKAGRPADTKAVGEDDVFGAADLITIVQSSTYNDNEPTPFRTQAYRLLRVLLDSNPDIVKRYVQTLRTESDAQPKIQIDADAIDATLKTWVETPLKASAASPTIKAGMADTAKLAIHRGDLLLATNRTADALRWYNADSKDARAARAVLTRYSRTPVEAVRALARASVELPDYGLVQYHFGALDIQDKKDMQAQLTALERAVQLLPLMGRSYGELARLYTLNGQAEKAMPLIAKALELEPEYADHFFEIRADTNLALGQPDRAFRDVNMAATLPHGDKAATEHYVLRIAAVRKKIETARRDADSLKLDEIRKEVDEKEARLEPPKPIAPPPPPVPVGRIDYQIEARATIEVVNVVYPDYPEQLRRNGNAGTVNVRVEVGPDGKVKSAVVSNSKLPAMNTPTLEAVKQWTFKPGNRTIQIVFNYLLE